MIFDKDKQFGMDHYNVAAGFNLVRPFTATSRISVFAGWSLSESFGSGVTSTYNVHGPASPVASVHYQISW